MNISKEMLPHSVKCYKVIGRTSDRKPTYGDSVTLSNVWFNETIGMNEGSNGKTSSDSAILFYDILNSNPSDFEFEKDMKIVFDERSFFVKSIHSCYGLNGLEHFEVSLT